MEVRPRQELFRKYVQWVERRLQAQEEEQDEDGVGGRPGEEELLAEAGALLVTPPSEPAQRFRLVPFYEVAENTLHSPRDSGLRALETAFATLETVCVNLLLFPWKKEFRCIKTFTGPFVYLLKAALCDSDLRTLLRSMGYTQDKDLQLRAGAPPGGTPHLRQLAFELFLARAECRLIADAVLRAGEGATEIGALEARRGARDERDRERGRTCVRRSVRSSRSVDVADGAGSWQPAVRPVLRATLSLRKDPCCQEPEEGPAGDCPRAAMAPLCPARFLARTPPTEPPEPLAYQLDELDLYADRAMLRQPPTPPPRPPARDLWGPRGQGTKCQGCARWYPGSVACSQSAKKLCPACCAEDPPRPCPRPLDAHLLAAEKLSVYPGAPARPQWLQKPPTAPKPHLSKPAMVPGGSRCGFCDKPGASHTCLICSKVSCTPCMTLYARDVCGRKNAHHSFTPNHQLSYKCGVLSHLVHR
ncbi:spermatogenesis-associated protein 2-like [Scleropages formosus]|nr:spermatogenesis-associated protein 2-like [Scleropages formosus]XP_029108410.1 spermatogenesis-associated protein 2-like [Scleropages formosus]XP_029108411.1 spermatogenesis-associated protein 2-like [Scleropages formosus]